MSRRVVIFNRVQDDYVYVCFFFFSSRRRHTRLQGDWSSDVCSSDLKRIALTSLHVITKIDRMKTRQGDSLFLKVDVGGETVRVFGRPEELAERLEASGYDIPASEIEAGMELHLPCLVKIGQGHNGYKNIEEFLPEAAE